MTRPLALLLTVLTGFSGLTYEVAWQKYLAALLGSHSEATAAVLAIFLGGLAGGYWLFGTLTRRLVAQAEAAGRPPRLLLMYGLLEAGIGVYVILFPWLFELARALSFRMPSGAAGLAFAFDVLLALLLIGPPALLMGGTIPILTQALARSLADATRFHAFVYGFNTAGAFAGALCAGFFLIPLLGLVRVMVAMGLVNLGAGAIFVLLGLRPRAVVPLQEERVEAPGAEGFATYAGAALLAGFAMMAVQTVLIRLGGLAFGSSEFTFSMVVAVFVLCIALGSLAVSALPRIQRVDLPISLWLLALLLYLLYGALPDAPYWAHVLRTVFRNEDAALYAYYLAAFFGLLAAIGIPVMLSGALLPLLFHQVRRELGELGASAGKLYSWNTVGSLLGALLGGYALLFWVDLHHVYRIAVAALALAAVLVTVRLYALPRWTAAFLSLVAVSAVSLREPWSPSLLSSGLFRSREAMPWSYRGPEAVKDAMRTRLPLIFYEDGPTLSVAVAERHDRTGMVRSLISNGRGEGSTTLDYPTMALIALVPALFADDSERAFVIGYGLGVTAGELAALESTREVVVAEISSSVLRAAPLFGFANRGALFDPEVRVMRSDAYRALLRSRGTWDIIASEPSNPWVTGVEMLFSREFLEAARDHLSPGGVYAQWFHQYDTDTETIALVLRTYASVFDHVAVWVAGQRDLLLLGFEDSSRALDLERLERRAAQPDVAAGLRRAGVKGFAGLLAHELLPLGVVHAMGHEGPVHTLYHPLLHYQAGRAFFRGTEGRLPFSGGDRASEVGRRNSLLRRYAARFDGRLPDDLRAEALEEICRHRMWQCAALAASWSADGADPAALEEIFDRTGKSVAYGGRVEPATAGRLAELFAPAEERDRARVTPQAAFEATRMFASFYHHAAPFEGEALLDLWSRCRAPRGLPGACAQGLEITRQLLAGRILALEDGASRGFGESAATAAPR